MKVLLAFTGLVTILLLTEACPMIYMPVCGTDGVTYSNKCFMRAHAHRHNLTITVAMKGKCASSTKDICSLGSETGPCKASFPRWFYDVKKGKCSQFIYGGCDGNKNNFRTEEECEKRCDSEKTAEYPCFRSLQKALSPSILVNGVPVPIHKNTHLPSCDREGYFTHKQCDKSKGECWCVNRLGKEILNTRKQAEDVSCDVCSLPKVVGPCKAAFPRWFFNKASGKCEQFIYGGCNGNENNFEGQETCQAMCLPHKLRVEKVPSSCQKEALEATQKPLLGRFTPRCNPDGSYHLTQCHPSTGFCWCSNPDGVKYPGSEVRGRPECEKYKALPEVTTLFAAVPAQSKCEKELLESTQKPLFGRFTPRCNPDGSYHLIQCHPSTGFCWCSNPDGTKYSGTEVRGKPECEKYKPPPVASTLFAAVPARSKCQQELLESTQKPLLGRFTPRCNPDGSYRLIQCHPSTGFCWCSNPDGAKYPGTEVRGKPECEKYKSHPVSSTLFAAVPAQSKCQQQRLESAQKPLLGRFTPQCNPDGSYHLTQCHPSTGFCWCSNPDGTKYPGTEVRGKPNCEKYKSLLEVKSVADVPVVTKKQEPLVKAAYQEKETQNNQSSSPASSGSSTAIIVLSVCAALCVMGVVGVLFVRKRRGSDRYGRLPETSFQTTAGEKQPLVHA